MLKKGEVISVLLAILAMALILSYVDYNLTIGKLHYYLLFSLIIIGISVLSKKVTARYLDTNAEITTWGWQRWGIPKRSYFKKPIPVGLLLPIIIALLGYNSFLCFLEFNATALSTKVVKKYGRRRFSGIMEWDDALIVFYSIIPLLILGIILSLFSNQSFIELSKLSTIYVLWNMIPFSGLDGNKLFFGSRPLYIFTWILIGISSLIVFL